MALLRLASSEVAFVAAYLARLRSWDDRAAVRLQARGAVVGLYGSLPMEALSLVVVPLADTVSGTDLEELDRTVSAGRLRDVIGSIDQAGAPDGAVRELRLPDPVAGPASLAQLPPRQGWVSRESGVAGDLRPGVEAAIAAFRSDVPAAGSIQAELVATATWDAGGWGGLSMRVLHAALLLGFLAHDGAQVSTLTVPGWTRLVTPAGQVFEHSGSRRDSLRVVSFG